MASTIQKSKRQIQRGIIHPFMDPVSLSSFLITRVSLQALFSVKWNLPHVLEDLCLVNRRSDKCWRALANSFKLWNMYIGGAAKNHQVLLFHPTVAMNEPRSDVFATSWTQERPLIISCATNFALLETPWHPKERHSELLNWLLSLD